MMTTFNSVDLTKACLRYANLANTRGWGSVKLTNANLTGAVLIHADFFSLRDTYELPALTYNPLDLWGTITMTPIDFDTAKLDGVKIVPPNAFHSTESLLQELDIFNELLKGKATYGYLKKLVPEAFNFLRIITAADLIQRINASDLSTQEKIVLLENASKHSWFNLNVFVKSNIYSFFGVAQPETGFQMIIQAIEKLNDMEMMEYNV